MGHVTDFSNVHEELRARDPPVHTHHSSSWMPKGHFCILSFQESRLVGQAVIITKTIAKQPLEPRIEQHAMSPLEAKIELQDGIFQTLDKSWFASGSTAHDASPSTAHALPVPSGSRIAVPRSCLLSREALQCEAFLVHSYADKILPYGIIFWMHGHRPHRIIGYSKRDRAEKGSHVFSGHRSSQIPKLFFVPPSPSPPSTNG